jgi:Ni,Fe-hydrogenase I cytochrome b subunit
MERKIMKIQNKVGFEFFAILILAIFLIVTQNFTSCAKLCQLSIAAFSSGMLIHSWVRWQTLINLDKKNETGSIENIYGYIWPFWLTLSIVAWTIFGEDLLSDITATLTTDNTSSGNTAKAGANESPDQLNNYVTGLTIIIAIVTGFYLTMLHTATQHARESAKEARDSVSSIEENHQKIQQLENEQNDTEKLLQCHLKFLNKRFLLPMLDDLESLMETNEAKQEKIEKRIRLLQAELSLFNIIESESCEQFIQRWEDVAAYTDDIFNKYNYSHLFQLAQERLETLCQECSQKQLEQVYEIKESIRSYEYQNHSKLKIS